MAQDDVLKWLRRGWWATRGALLFILPLPLIIAMLMSLFKGDLADLIVDVAALSLFLAGALVSKKGFNQLAAHEEQGLSYQVQSRPYRTMGAGLVAAGTFVASHFGIGNDALFSVFMSGLCVLGYYFSYGLDPLVAKPAPRVGDVAMDELQQTLLQAREKINAIDAARRHLNNAELASRLQRICQLAQHVLKTIEQSPKDLHKARKFLYVYLDGTKTVCERYAKTHEHAASAQLESNFRNVLVTIEDVFEQQQRRLLERELLDLDVQIEVLNTQLKREGLS